MARDSIFRSRQEFADTARKAGVTAETCVWVASTELIEPMLGIGINNGSEEGVREAFAKLGNTPADVEITQADPGKYNNAAKVACQLCGQCTVFVGPTDCQSTVTPVNPDNRACPIWATKPN